MSGSRTFWTLAGHDSAHIEQILRLNANDQLQVEVVKGQSTYVQVDPQLLPAAEADLWDPGADAGDAFDVSFILVNVDGTNSATATVGQNVGGDGGNLTAAEYFAFQVPVPPGMSTGLFGPFRIGGDDHIRGVASAADDVAIHFKIEKVVDV